MQGADTTLPQPLLVPAGSEARATLLAYLLPAPPDLLSHRILGLLVPLRDLCSLKALSVVFIPSRATTEPTGKQSLTESSKGGSTCHGGSCLW